MLANPTNGSVSIPAGTEFEDEAVYSCYTGFELSGNNRRCCLSTGSWSGTDPTCVPTGRLILKKKNGRLRRFRWSGNYYSVCLLLGLSILRDVLATKIKNTPIRSIRMHRQRNGSFFNRGLLKTFLLNRFSKT